MSGYDRGADDGRCQFDQDLGRNGRFDIGVSRSGAMDRLSLMIGNALLGNDLNAAGLEIAIFPFRLRFDQPARFAVTGAEGAVTLAGRPLPARWAASAAEGETLVIAPPEKGARVYITFAGGIDVEPVLGSRATDLKSGYGGLEGRGLKRGDRLNVTPKPPMRAFGQRSIPSPHWILPIRFPSARSLRRSIPSSAPMRASFSRAGHGG